MQRIAFACSEHCGVVSFASKERRRSMPRKGWSAVPTPAGWFEVIRGLRPPGKGKGQERRLVSFHVAVWQQGAQILLGRWKRGPIATSQSSSKVRSLEAAMATLGLEESSAKTEIALAFEYVIKHETAQVVFDPEARMAAGRDKVALELGDFKGPAMGVGGSVETCATRRTGDAFGIVDSGQGSIPGESTAEDRPHQPRTSCRSSQSRSANVGWNNFGLPGMCSRRSHHLPP